MNVSDCRTQREGIIKSYCSVYSEHCNSFFIIYNIIKIILIVNKLVAKKVFLLLVLACAMLVTVEPIYAKKKKKHENYEERVSLRENF